MVSETNTRSARRRASAQGSTAGRTEPEAPNKPKKTQSKEEENPPAQPEEPEYEPGSRNRDLWGTWRRPFDFTLTVVGYAVGVHDFWRFPFLCYKFGGIFFIPYTVALIIIALPTSFVEFTIGQYYGVGATEAFGTMAPILTGISYLLAWNSVTTCWMYAMMITWSRLYSSDAFSCTKGWETCDPGTYYNSARCYTGHLDDLCEVAYFRSHRPGDIYRASDKEEGVLDYLYFNFKCVSLKEYCAGMHGKDWKAEGGKKRCRHQRTGREVSIYQARVHACAEYFYGGVCGLRIANDTVRNPDNIRSTHLWKPNPRSTSDEELRTFSLTTFLTIIIFLAEGLLAVGAITYFLNGVPFVGLGYFTVKALALPHSVAGMEALVSLGDFASLQKPEIWVEAVIQAIGTAGIGNGVLLNLATFNKPHHNYIFDICFTSFLNLVCSLCTVLICFCTIGHYIRHHRVNLGFQEFIQVSSYNSSLEFGYIVYTIFLSITKADRFSTILFFTMITSFSMDSALRLVQNTLDALVSIFPRLRKYRLPVLVGVSLFGVAVVVPMTRNGGMLMFLEYEYFLVSYVWIFVLLAQTIGVNWVYRTSRILDHAEQHGIISSWVFRFYLHVCQQVLSPIILAACLGYNLYFHTRVRFNDVESSIYIEVFGFTFCGTPIIVLIISIIEQLLLNPVERWSWLSVPLKYHRADTLELRRFSAVAATNYGPMTKKEDEEPERTEANIKTQDAILKFVSKWRKVPVEEKKDEVEADAESLQLRAGLLSDKAIEKADDDPGSIVEDFDEADEEGNFQQYLVNRIQETVLFYEEWPGRLETDTVLSESSSSDEWQ